MPRRSTNAGPGVEHRQLELKLIVVQAFSLHLNRLAVPVVYGFCRRGRTLTLLPSTFSRPS